MAIAFVQNKVNGAGADNVTTTFDSTPTEGNLIIAAGIGQQDRTFVSISTGYNQKQIDENPPTFIGTFHLFWKKAGAAESTSVVLTINANDNIMLHLWEFSGTVVDADPFDVENALNEANGTSLALTATGVLSQADEVILAFAQHLDSAPVTGITWSDSFINPQYFERAGGTGSANASASRIVSATTSISTTATMTASTAADNWGKLVSIKQLAAAGATVRSYLPTLGVS